MPYRPIVGTLGYLVSADRQAVLLVHRNARADDPHFGKYNGLGGKLEPDESILEGLRREFREEAGIELVAPRLRGTINWPGFTGPGDDWLGFIFLIEGYSGTPHASNPEGSLEWIPIEILLRGELSLWEGDRYFLPLIFSDDLRQFHGVMPYKEGRPVSWSYELL